MPARQGADQIEQGERGDNPAGASTTITSIIAIQLNGKRRWHQSSGASRGITMPSIGPMQIANRNAIAEIAARARRTVYERWRR